MYIPVVKRINKKGGERKRRERGKGRNRMRQKGKGGRRENAQNKEIMMIINTTVNDESDHQLMATFATMLLSNSFNRG